MTELSPRSRCVLLAAALWAAIATPAPGQPAPGGIRPQAPLAELQATHWTKSVGLPADTLIDVEFTPQGYVWISAFGGLARFDGIDFEVYNEKSVAELDVSGFYEVLERDGVLWIATQGSGVWKFDGRRFSPAAANQSSSSVRSVLFDRSGNLWAGLADHGAVWLSGSEFVSAGYPVLENVTVRDILESRDGALWFATEGAGLTRLDQGRTVTFTTASGLAGNAVSCLWESADGALWVGTQSGLSRLQGGAISVVPELAGVEIFAIAEDDYGSLWIGAEQGLYRRHGDSGRLEKLVEYRGVSLRSINGLAFDHEGGVWVSSYFNGLFRFREGRIASRTRDDGLASDRVNSVYERRDGTLLIGGDGGAVQVLDAGRLSRLPLRRPLPDVRVRGFLDDSRGDLWIASYAGALRLSGDDQTLFTESAGLPTRRARFVFEDRAGRIWVGTRGGGLVEMGPKGALRALGTADGLLSDFVLSVAEDAEDLLIGTQAGLNVLSPDGRISSYTIADGLPADLIFNIRIDAQGIAWLATTGGLARFSDGKIDALTVRDGLPSGAVYDYAEDDKGDVWLSSSEGMVRIAKSRLVAYLDGRQKNLEPRLFAEDDGMADAQCTGGARMVQARGGALWVPTLGGLSRIAPNPLPRNALPPPVFVHRVRIDGRPPNELASGRRPEVDAGARRFEFWFSALSYQSPSKVEVQYLLEGFDEEWMPAGLQRKALYTHLPPGEYVFRVIAANEDGVWNTAGASYALRVRPHYYQTPVFLLSAAVALMLLPWGVYRWRLGHVQRRSSRLEMLLAEQERLERERTRLIGELERRNEQLEDLTHAVSHDLKSPLVTIQGFVGALDKDLTAGDHARVDKDLDRIREAATYMGRLLDQLSKVRRLERNEARLEEIDLGALAGEVLALVAGRIRNRRIRTSVDPTMPPVLGDRLQLTEVLQNLIDNAARFMGDQPRPRIEIGWRQDDQGTVYFVRDNGIGIESRHQERVFTLFQRLDHRHDGTGVGLAIVRRVVESHQGRVWIESEGAGQGATFCFTLRGARSSGPSSG